jgi:all-trans-retinol 13,14-reductase
MNNRTYDVVILGSGLGGLLCGAILSKFNQKVCVLEKHHQVGGNLQTFVRKGIKFNSAMHYVGSLDEGQILHQVFTYLGIMEKIGVERLNSDCYEKIFIGEKEYCNATGVDAYKDRLLSYFPEEKNAIETYIQKIQEVWTKINILNLRDINDISDQETQYTYENACDFIYGLTDNEELRSLLSITNGLYAGIPEKSSLLTHAIISYHYMQSAYKFSDGSDQLAMALAQVIVDNGGVVQTNKTAVNFLFEDKQASAIELEDGLIVKGRAFISNIHPANTIKMVEPGRFRKAYVNRIEGLQNTIGSFCVYITLKKNMFLDIPSNVYISASHEVWGAGKYDQLEWPSTCMLYTKPDKDNPEFAESLAVAVYMKYEELEQWEGTGIEKRGKEYQAFKKQKAEAILNLIETKYPDIRASVEEYYTASPLTFQDYTNNPEGSIYGVLKDCNNPRASFISSTTRVPNLFLTGQNTGVGLHGVLGVTISALFTCANFIEINALLSRIRDENFMA